MSNLYSYKRGQTAGSGNLSSLVVPTGIEPVSKV